MGNKKTSNRSDRAKKVLFLYITWFIVCPLLYFVLMALHVDLILAIYVVGTFLLIACAFIPILINVILKGRRPQSQAETARRKQYFHISKMMFLFILPLAITLLVSLVQFMFF